LTNRNEQFRAVRPAPAAGCTMQIATCPLGAMWLALCQRAPPRRAEASSCLTRWHQR
jgi:hypothetical protein